MAYRGGLLIRLVATAASATVLLIAAGGQAAAQSGGITSHTISQSPEAVLDYWTPERIRAAEPVVPPASPGAGTVEAPALAAAIPPDQETDPALDTLFPQRVHGRVLVQLAGQLATCSATVVNTQDRDLIITAAHCLVDPSLGAFADFVLFRPAYRYDAAPFGDFAATRFATPKAFAQQGNIGFDFGAVELAPSPNGLGLVQDAVGARGIAFNRPPKSFRNDNFEVYGYPVQPEPDYDGQRLILCRSSFLGFERFSGAPVVSPCHQQGGSSGGGWARGDRVESLISHSGCPTPSTACTEISGSYFGETEFKIYRKLGGISKGKKKKLKRCKKRHAKSAKRVRCRSRVQRFRADSG